MKNQLKIAELFKRQEVKFAAIGGFNTILDIAILLFLSNLGLSKIISNIFSTGTTFLISFGLNKKYTFKSGSKTKKALAREMILFTVVTLFGLWVIQGVIISALLPLLKGMISNESIATVLAKIPATCASLVWNFILYKKVVFRKRQKSEK